MLHFVLDDKNQLEVAYGHASLINFQIAGPRRASQILIGCIPGIFH